MPTIESPVECFCTLTDAVLWHVRWAIHNRKPVAYLEDHEVRPPRDPFAVAIEKWLHDHLGSPGPKYKTWWNLVLIFCVDPQNQEAALQVPVVVQNNDTPGKLRSFCQMIHRQFPQVAAQWPAESIASVGGRDGDAAEPDYRPATWFPKGMAARLRMAAGKQRKSKRVATRIIDGVKCYRVADARRWWANEVPREANDAK